MRNPTKLTIETSDPELMRWLCNSPVLGSREPVVLIGKPFFLTDVATVRSLDTFVLHAEFLEVLVIEPPVQKELFTTS